MSDKTKRLLSIKKLISAHKISSQDELLNQLIKSGFELTQATLSRDLKFLKVGKIADPDKGYVYFLPDVNKPKPQKSSDLKDNNFISNGFISLQFSHHLGVIRTKAGYASTFAMLIDSNLPYEIIGTIAGDDTILIVPHEDATREDIKNALVMIIPELDGRI